MVNLKKTNQKKQKLDGTPQDTMNVGLQSKIRIATIVLFIKALIGELDSKDKKKPIVQKIAVECNKFMRKYFTVQSEKDILGEVANESWQLACDMGEVEDVYISTIIPMLFTSKYHNELKAMTGIKDEWMSILYNNSSIPSIADKKRNKAIALHCIQCINKVLYDKLSSKE